MKLVNTIKPLLISIAMTMSSLSATASELSAPRSLFPDHKGNIAPQLNFDQNETGDVYVAYRINAQGDFYFLNKDGVTLDVVPLKNIDSYNGSIELPEYDTAEIPAGKYQLYEVLVKPGTDPFDVDNWVGGIESLRSLNFSLGQSDKANFDFDGDGWSDDDSNRDGFHDDDRDQDGFHDDDQDKDGLHDDDRDRDGYHDDDKNHDGLHDSEQGENENDND